MKSAKELAWELGLLRKRSSSTSAAKKLTKANQLFTHLIVIDFESTCWKDQKFKTQEIIEFPAVLLDTRTGEIIEEFHQYVQPQESPTLSAFCKQLTGITQEQVDDGIPLNFCLSRFNQWLKKVATKYNIIFYNSDSPSANRCTFVTWSDWDLSVCLNYECKRKQLRKPPELNSWIDLRAVYRKFYCRKPQGLNGALKDVGIIFEGREHSGVCDARNTAKLASKMMQEGCIMAITRTLDGGLMPPPKSAPSSKPPATVVPPSSDPPPKPAMKRTFSAPSLQHTPSKPQSKKLKISTSPVKPEKTVARSELEELEMLLTLSPHLPKQPVTEANQDTITSNISEEIVDTFTVQGNNLDSLRKPTMLKKQSNGSTSAKRSISQCIQLLTTSKQDSVSENVNSKDNHNHSPQTVHNESRTTNLLKTYGSESSKTRDDSPMAIDKTSAPVADLKLVKTPVKSSKSIPSTTFKVFCDDKKRESPKKVPWQPSKLKDITNTCLSPAVTNVGLKFGENSTAPAQRKIDSCFKAQKPKAKQTSNQPFKTPSRINTSTVKPTPNQPFKTATNMKGTSVKQPTNTSFKTPSSVNGPSMKQTPNQPFKTQTPNGPNQPFISTANTNGPSVKQTPNPSFKTPPNPSVKQTPNQPFKTQTPNGPNQPFKSTTDTNGPSVKQTPNPSFKTPSNPLVKQTPNWPFKSTANTNGPSVKQTPTPSPSNPLVKQAPNQPFKTPNGPNQPFKSTANANCPSVKQTPNPSFKTPSNPLVKQTPNQPFKTPSNFAHNPSGMKRTPPLCECGRRSHRKMVQNPGPNVGRFFYACPQGRKGLQQKSGCGFFKWEERISVSTSKKSNPVLPQSNIKNFAKSVPRPCNETRGVTQANYASPVLQNNTKVINSEPAPSTEVTSHIINGMSYSRMFESPLPQPNFDTPSSDRAGSFKGTNNISVIANGRANTVLKPPMF